MISNARNALAIRSLTIYHMREKYRR